MPARFHGYIAETAERESMKHPGLALTMVATMAALLLGACAQPQTDTAHRAVSLAPVPDATSGYRPLAMAGASDKQAKIGIDFDKLGKDQDLKLALMYGIDATASLKPDEGAPETGLTYTGAGDSWKHPIVVRGQAAALSTIANAYRFIAERYPGSRVQSSTLYAGPPPNFVTRVEFSSGGGDQALYFDLTDWAKAWRKEVPD
jgi:hypothetical protein